MIRPHDPPSLTLSEAGTVILPLQKRNLVQGGEDLPSVPIKRWWAQISTLQHGTLSPRTGPPGHPSGGAQRSPSQQPHVKRSVGDEDPDGALPDPSWDTFLRDGEGR